MYYITYPFFYIKRRIFLRQKNIIRIKISPNEEAFYNLLGNLEEAENNFTEALKIYEMIKVSHPHSFQNKVSLKCFI